MSDVSEYVTVAQAAALLGLSKSRLEQFIGGGRISVAVVMGNARLLLRKDVEAIRPAVRGKAGRPPKESPRGE